MISRKNILVLTALVLSWAAPVFAVAPVYSEAAGRWSSAQAVKLPPAITADFLKEVAVSRGAAEAAALAGKKEKVSALLERFKTCSLNAGDLQTAEKYFTPEFNAEIRYFVQGGCAAFRGSADGRVQAPDADISAVEELAASGRLAAPEGAARFFDGSASRGAAPAVTAGRAAYRPSPVPAAAAQPSKPLSSRVAAPPEGLRAGVTPPERPADIGKDGRVNQAAAYWSQLRRESWAAYRSGELSGAAKAKALAKAAAGAGFGGLLYYSNLPNVEIAAARLRWDVGHGAGAGVIAADSAKFVFHSGVFILALAPIPMLKVAKAALSGEAWAIALMATFTAGPINRYVVHFAD